MAKSTLLTFDLDLNNPEALLSKLELFSKIQNPYSGWIFFTPHSRMMAHQHPYNVNLIEIYTSKGEIILEDLPKIIKENLEVSVIHYRDEKNCDIIRTYELPEAINKDPSKRKLPIIGINEKLGCLNNQT